MKKIILFATLLSSLLSLNVHSRDSWDGDWDRGHNRGCYNSNEIMHEAHDLDNSANHFARLLRNRSGYSHLTHDAKKLARAASHLHRVTENGSSCEHIRNDFRNVTREFRHLKRQLRNTHEDHHNGHVMQDFDEVKYSFQGLRRTRSLQD